MANNIRGITVEIGGDTKKLNEALSGTSKEIKTAESELKKVEKALKLDPTNTELLAQKQELLAKAAEQARAKLSALQQAQAKMSEAHAANADWEKAYAPLREEIEAAAKALNSLTKQEAQARSQFESGEMGADEYGKLQKALAAAEEKTRQLAKAKSDLDSQFASGHISDEEFRKFQRDVVEAKDKVKSLEKELKSSDSAFSSFSDSAKAAGDKIGGFADAVAPVSTAAAGLIAGAVAVSESTEELRTDLSKLDNNARQAGIGIGATREAFEAFNVVSDETDSSVEATSNLLQAGFTESNLQKAVEGLSGAYLSFPDTMKIESLADSLQETLATGQATGQFGELLDRLGVGAQDFSDNLAKCTTEADKQNLALSVLSGTGMMDAYEGWKQNNGELVKSKQANYDLKESMAQLGEAVQPLVSEGMQVLSSIVEKIASGFGSLNKGTQKFIVTAILLVAALSPVLKLVSSVFGAVSNVSAGMGVLGKAGGVFASGAGSSVYLTFLKWVGIIIAVVAVITALVVAISVLTGKGDEMSRTMDSMGKSVSDMGSAATSNIPQYASGTDYHPGGLALVGEEGAELVSLPRGARVYSNRDTASMLNSGGQGQTESGNGVSRDDVRELQSSVKELIVAVKNQSKDVYLDGQRVTRKINEQQKWLQKTEGSSFVGRR